MAPSTSKPKKSPSSSSIASTGSGGNGKRRNRSRGEGRGHGSVSTTTGGRDETSSLSGNGESRTDLRRRDAAMTWNMRCMRLTFLLIVISLVALSVYFDRRLQETEIELVAERQYREVLAKRVASQQLVIDRVNNSITNKDISDRVDVLANDLSNTESRIMDQLVSSESRIGTRLNTTISLLDSSVSKAQEEISEQVAIVESDFSEYKRATEDQFSMENHFMVFQLAGTFTLLACLISMWHTTAHFRKFRQPFVQRKILAILMMTPIYGITSWLSLVVPSMHEFFSILKDFYEAYVIYQFLSFLIAVLGKGDRAAVVDLLADNADHLDPPVQPFKLCCGPRKFENDRAMADAVLLQCQFFAMQFVLLKPVTAITQFLCNFFGYYGGGDSPSDYRSPQFWIVVIQNVSVFMAFSGLLKFYHAVQDELEWCRPFPKFLCIKGIVFMTFWQGLVIDILAKTTNASDGALSSSGGEDDDDKNVETWAKQAQNFLICLEMLLFSIAHFYCFPVDEWDENYQSKQGSKPKTRFGDNIALRDFLQDLKLVIVQQGNSSRSVRKSVSSTKKAKGLPGKGSQPSSPLLARSPHDDEDDEDDLEQETPLARVVDPREGCSLPLQVAEAAPWDRTSLGNMLPWRAKRVVEPVDEEQAVLIQEGDRLRDRPPDHREDTTDDDDDLDEDEEDEDDDESSMDEEEALGSREHDALLNDVNDENFGFQRSRISFSGLQESIRNDSLPLEAREAARRVLANPMFLEIAPDGGDHRKIRQQSHDSARTSTLGGGIVEGERSYGSIEQDDEPEHRQHHTKKMSNNRASEIPPPPPTPPPPLPAAKVDALTFEEPVSSPAAKVDNIPVPAEEVAATSPGDSVASGNALDVATKQEAQEAPVEAAADSSSPPPISPPPPPPRVEDDEDDDDDDAMLLSLSAEDSDRKDESSTNTPVPVATTTTTSAAVGEETNLLSSNDPPIPSTTNSVDEDADMLRPSIFTAIGDMGGGNLRTTLDKTAL